ncbi:MAG: acylphosphatase [Planctomycetota bacterium]|nr:MAG: acylphosphatase [Planctomycetota bacterium]
MRAEVTFIGKVQGVGFRATAKRLADAAGVTGWVRNEADGSVHLVAEGRDETVRRFLDDLRDRLAGFISREDLTEGEATGRYAGFEIRH